MKNKRLIGAKSLRERYRILEADRDRDEREAFALTDEEARTLSPDNVPTDAPENKKKEATEKLKELQNSLKAKLKETGDSVTAEGKVKELLSKLNLDDLFEELSKQEILTNEENQNKILKAFDAGKAETPAAPEETTGPEKPPTPSPAPAGTDGATPPATPGATGGNETERPGASGRARGGARADGTAAPQVVTGQPIQVLGTEVTPERGRVGGRKTSIQLDANLAAQLIDNPEFKKLIQSGNADVHLAWDDDDLVAPLLK